MAVEKNKKKEENKVDQKIDQKLVKELINKNDELWQKRMFLFVVTLLIAFLSM